MLEETLMIENQSATWSGGQAMATISGCRFFFDKLLDGDIRKNALCLGGRPDWRRVAMATSRTSDVFNGRSDFGHLRWVDFWIPDNCSIVNYYLNFEQHRLRSLFEVLSGYHHILVVCVLISLFVLPWDDFINIYAVVWNDSENSFEIQKIKHEKSYCKYRISLTHDCKSEKLMHVKIAKRKLQIWTVHV